MKSIFLLFALVMQLLASDNLAQIKSYIQKSYEKKYENYQIHISNISISTPANMPLQSYKINSISLDSKYLTKKDGIVLVNVQANKSLLSLPLQYQIQASIDIYRAAETIKTTQDITDKNTAKDSIAFDKITQTPISTSAINHSSAKSYINANSIITTDKIQPKILIRKNDSFIGFIKEGPISVQTTLIAKENGAFGDIINAINPESKKIIRVKVTGTDKGEVL